MTVTFIFEYKNIIDILNFFFFFLKEKLIYFDHI